MPLAIPAPLDADAFHTLRRRAIFECCKWDPQVEDVCTVAPFPLVVDPAAWAKVSLLAEALAREVAAAEDELRQTPRLQKQLGIPRAIRKVLAKSPDTCPDTPRLVRFDFHFSSQGWRISEANTDVAGGYNEASGYLQLMGGHYPQLEPCGDPAGRWADALAAVSPLGGRIGLVHATAYTDDRQVMSYLARELRARQRHPVLLAPDSVTWRSGEAFCHDDGQLIRLEALARFFPGEWLPNLSRGSGWRHFFVGSRTLLCNPASAVLTQTKRFPLVWDALGTSMEMWRKLLPVTLDPRDPAWRRDPDQWVFKPAFGRVGDSIGFSGTTSQKNLQRIRRFARRYPSEWVVQERFETQAIETHLGPMYPCLGVYTVNGQTAGAYGRLGRTPLIDHLALDAPVFIGATTEALGHETNWPAHPSLLPAGCL